MSFGGLNLFSNLGGYGGYQIVTENYIRGLRRVLAEQDMSFVDNVNMLGISTSSTQDPFNTRGFLKTSNRLHSKIHDISLGILPSDDALKFHGKKRILYPAWEGSKLPEHHVTNLNTLDQVWCTCAYMGEVYVNSGVKQEKVKVVRGGYDPLEYRPILSYQDPRIVHLPTRRITGETPISKEDPFVFLMVGKYEERKASKQTVAAFCKVIENHPLRDFVQLRIKHSSSVLTRNIHHIKNDLAPIFARYPRAANRVSFVDGNEINMVHLYNRSDCLILASRAEGIGLPLLEAMGCGLMTICTPYTSFRDFTDPSTNVILPDRGMQPAEDPFYGITPDRIGNWGVVNMDDIADAIRTVLNMTDMNRYQMGMEAHKKASTEFDFIHSIRKSVEYLREL